MNLHHFYNKWCYSILPHQISVSLILEWTHWIRISESRMSVFRQFFAIYWKTFGNFVKRHSQSINLTTWFAIRNPPRLWWSERYFWFKSRVRKRYFENEKKTHHGKINGLIVSIWILKQYLYQQRNPLWSRVVRARWSCLESNLKNPVALITSLKAKLLVRRAADRLQDVIIIRV